MANPFASLGTVDVMGTVLGMLQKQATLRDTQLLGDEREQHVAMLKQDMAQRAMTMRALQQDLQGGLQTQIDKSNIPTDSDTLIGGLQKQVRQEQKLFQDSLRRSNLILQNGGRLEDAEREKLMAREAAIRTNTAMTQLRMAQHEQAKTMGETAAAANADNFNSVILPKLREIDPGIDKKYSFDRDVNDQPVWGERTAKTLQTIGAASMSAQTQLDEARKTQEALQKGQEREEKLRLDKIREKKLNAEAAIAQENADRARKGQPLLGHETGGERTGASTSAGRLQAIADKGPSKEAQSAARSSILSYAKEKGYEFDSESLTAFGQALAAKTNSIRAAAAKNGEDMDLEEARGEALDALSPFIKKNDKEVPWYLPGKSEHKMSFSYPGVAAQAAKPATGSELQTRFEKDAAMKGNKLGKQTPRGFEVFNSAGKLIGYYE